MKEILDFVQQSCNFVAALVKVSRGRAAVVLSRFFSLSSSLLADGL